MQFTITLDQIKAILQERLSYQDKLTEKFESIGIDATELIHNTETNVDVRDLLIKDVVGLVDPDDSIDYNALSEKEQMSYGMFDTMLFEALSETMEYDGEPGRFYTFNDFVSTYFMKKHE